MKYHFKIHKEKKGYWSECLELKGCVTQAGSLKELYIMMEDALNLYLSEPESSKVIFPLPLKRTKKTSSTVQVAVRPEVAVSFLLRNCRLKLGMSQRNFAISLGKKLFSYQKLEKSGNPELKTLIAIKKKYPQIPFNEIFDIN